MSTNANSISVGNVIEHKSKLWQVVKTQHTKPGKGGAFIQMELKEIPGGTKLNERFRSTEVLEKVRLDDTEFQYLYTDSTGLVLMDMTNYEQISIVPELAGESAMFLQEGMTVLLQLHEGTPLSIKLPETVTLTVAETEGVVKGQTAASSYKPAIMDNGARVMVPPFINTGDKLVVRTADATYMERAK